MASKNAELVAKDVLETIRNGKKINMGKIIKKHGYSDTVSKAPTKVTKTKTYQKAMKPVLEQLDGLIQKALKELSIKSLEGERFKDITSSLDLLIKNKQLLGGGSTERMTIVLPSEIVDKNGLGKPSVKE